MLFRVGRLSLVDSQRGASAGDETAAGERMESPGSAAASAIWLSRHGDVADDVGKVGELVTGQLNRERLAGLPIFKEDSAHRRVYIDLKRLFGKADDRCCCGADVHGFR